MQARDAGELKVLPSLVDTHVHVSEPGRTEREGFSTTTQFARPSSGTTRASRRRGAIHSTNLKLAVARTKATSRDAGMTTVW